MPFTVLGASTVTFQIEITLSQFTEMQEELPPGEIGRLLYIGPDILIEAAPEVVDERPLIERIADKNWKARLGAYDDVRKELNGNPNGTFFVEYGALDSGFDTAVLFADKAPANLVLVHNDKLFANTVEKAFNGKTSTYMKGKSLLLKLMEIDEPTACTQFLMTKLADKKPKIPPTCLDVIKEGIGMFGSKPFPIKEIIKALPAVFDGTNGPARDSAMSLLVELYRWIGLPPLQSLLESVRSAQKSDFEKIIADKEEELKVRPRPSLYLRKERPLPGAEVIEAAPVAAKGSRAPAAVGDGADAREYVDEVDLAKKLRGTEYATLVADEKWSEQLKGLQLVIDAIGPVPKIKPGCDVHDIVATCKGFLRQGHVLLQVNSLKIITLLADGMRSEFTNLARPLMQSVVQKCKEKRLVPDVQATIRVVLLHCLSFDSFFEEVLEVITNKKSPPHAKIGMMETVAQTLQDMPEKIGVDNLKPLAEGLISVCEDSDVKVRDTCSVTLAALAPVVKAKGRFAADAYRALMALEQTAPRVFKKMQAAMEVGPAVTKPSGSDKSSAPAKKAADAISDDSSLPPLKHSAPVSKAAPSEKPSANPVNSSASSQISKSTTASAIPKKPAAAGAGTKSAAGSKKGKEAANDDEPVEELTMSPEEAKEVLDGLEIDGWESVQAGLASAKWQDKVDALAAIERKIVETKTGGQYSAAMVKYLSAQTSGFKISNINILKSVIQTLCAAAANSGGVKFNKPAAWELIKQFGDKISDKKTKENVETLLTALAENISVGFVLRGMRQVMDKTKAPTAHQYYLEWMKQAVADFGYSAFPVKDVSLFCQLEMDNKISAVRTAAVEVMGAFYHQIGPKFMSMATIDDSKTQLKALLDAEFAKVGFDPTAAAKASKGGDEAAAGGEIPRQDLLALVDRNIVSELNMVEGKNSWQNRKAAMEAIISACEKSGHFLEANKPTGEVVKALKARINDTQANLKPIAAAAIGHIIAALDHDSANKVLRIVSSSLMLGLADNKKQMRDATIAALHTAVTFNKQPAETAAADSALLASLLQPFSEALMNVVGRQEILAWLMQHIDSLKGEFHELAGTLVLTMQDKTASVRSLSEQMLTILMARAQISRIALDKATRDLPPATKRTLQGAIDRLNSVYGTAKKAPSAAPTVSVDTPAESSSPLPSPQKSEPSQIPTFSTVDEPPRRSGLQAPKTGSHARPGTAPAAPGSAVKEEADSRWQMKRTNKQRRLDEFVHLNWPQCPEEPGEHEFHALQTAWEPLLAPNLAHLLFPVGKAGTPVNQDSYLGGLVELQYHFECPHFFQHLDLVLRWCCCVLCLREQSSGGLLKLLQFVSDLFTMMHTVSSPPMHDAEIIILLPHLIDHSGHKSERHRVAFKQTIGAAGEIVSPNKITQLLLQGLASHNKKSRIVCVEEIQRVIETAGIGALGRSGAKEIAAFLDSKDTDLSGRGACLELIYTMYTALGNEQQKLMRLMGSDLSERSVAMIEDKIKFKNKAAGIAPQLSPTESYLKSEAESHAMMLEKIDAVIASTPMKDMQSSGRASLKSAGKGLNQKTKSSESLRSVEEPVPIIKAPSKTRESLVPKPSSASVELEMLCNEIVKKIDAYLYAPGTLSDKDVVYETARDYLKMLHSVLLGEWSSETLPEDDAVLVNQSQVFLARLVKCVNRAFSAPVNVLSPVQGSNLGIDVFLTAISLSTLFALVKRKDVAKSLPEASLFQLFHECLFRICDERILAPASDEASCDTAAQIVSAINMVVIKLAAEAKTSTTLCALLRVLFLCIPATEVNHGKEVALPIHSTKPVSRLIIKVLTDELDRPLPYDEASFDLRAVLLAIHNFFSHHPANTQDDTPFRTAKTVLNELIKAKGGQRIIAILQEQRISPSSFIYLLTSRLGKIQVNETDAELNSSIILIIDEITAARDKDTAIRKLHKIRRENPSLDINLYLQKISSAFRRFVLDKLAALDAADSSAAPAQDENRVPHSAAKQLGQRTGSCASFTFEDIYDQKHAHRSASSEKERHQEKVQAPLTAPAASVNLDVSAASIKASEAMRILEGLKSRHPNNFKGTGEAANGIPPRRNSNTRLSIENPTSASNSTEGPPSRTLSSRGSATASPFTKRNEQIRDSLYNLTASLDLPSSLIDEGDKSFAMDSEMSNRLQRLKDL